MKAYTDIEQSKVLKVFLPLKSADMCYCNDGNANEIAAASYENASQLWDDYYDEIIPCWSLAALLEILNNINEWYPSIDSQVGEKNNWQICMFSYETGGDSTKASSKKELIDACYGVILKLHEENLL